MCVTTERRPSHLTRATRYTFPRQATCVYAVRFAKLILVCILLREGVRDRQLASLARSRSPRRTTAIRVPISADSPITMLPNCAYCAALDEGGGGIKSWKLERAPKPMSALSPISRIKRVQKGPEEIRAVTSKPHEPKTLC